MPHSVFTGRPMPAPGEPLFLQEDTDLAVALALEERDTCPSCGLPKSVCRDPKAQFVGFEVFEETCFATETLALHRDKVDEKRTNAQRSAIQMSARFREDYRPDLNAGLGLPAGDGDKADED